MRDEYDFTGAKKNPYAAKLKEETSVVLDEEVAAYFRQQAEKNGHSLPAAYQSRW